MSVIWKNLNTSRSYQEKYFKQIMFTEHKLKFILITCNFYHSYYAMTNKSNFLNEKKTEP